MKRIGVVLAALCCMSLTSCQKEKEKENIVQHVTSCVECETCCNWSWGNGEGYPNRNGIWLDFGMMEYIQGYCSFRVLEDGELRMDYAAVVGWDDVPILVLSGGTSFYDRYQGDDFGGSLKTIVKKGTIVHIGSVNCKVMNVRIVSQNRTGDSEEDRDDF